MDTKILDSLKEFQKILFEDEIVQFVARQRRIGPGGSIFSPGVVVATNKRLIMIRDFLEFHIREDVDVIPYSAITYVKLQHNVMSSTIIIGILGFSGDRTPTSFEKSPSMMQMTGLRYDDAVMLVRLTEKMLVKSAEKKQVQEIEPGETKELEVKVAWDVKCGKCGAKNTPTAKFCADCGARL